MLQRLYNNITNKKRLKKYRKRVTAIRDHLKTVNKLSDEMIKELFEKYRKQKRTKENINELITLVIEKIDRMYGLKAYDVQLISALALIEGGLVEQLTGEGKALTGTIVSLIKALDGQVHISTVNEYLSRRDKELYEPLYQFFGLSASLNLQSDTPSLKKQHYKADIVYAMASTFGFDYLYDNMVYNYEDKLMKTHYFALIDEVDLILLDEARTPLIVGSTFDKDLSTVHKANHFVKKLVEEDYIIEPNLRAVYLSKQGEDKLKEEFGDSIFSVEKINQFHCVHQSLIAHYLYQKDVDYGVIHYQGEERVVIIDTFTGRIQPDRRFSNGLHQALESKEGLEIKPETTTTATITLQNFFKLYQTLSGMSGTVHEEREEFKNIYNLSVLQVPTNKPRNRLDMPTEMYSTKSEKWNRVLEKVREYHQRAFPILIGTSSVEESEQLSNLFTLANLNHVVLNAKQDKAEAKVIALAGKKGAITIATNMAGRGTDIITESETHPLVVFVTELNESTRIDNQLKGRTSRQGAYGITETIISAEDSIFLKTEQHKKLHNILNGMEPTNKVIQFLSKYVQKELESRNTSSRKSALKYDEIIKEHRNQFYKARDTVLLSKEDKLDLILKEIINSNTVLKELKERNFTGEVLRHTLLYVMDKVWIEHIDKLNTLKNAIGFRGITGQNPYIIYQNESNNLYQQLKHKMHYEFLIVLGEHKKSELKQADAYKERN